MSKIFAVLVLTGTMAFANLAIAATDFSAPVFGQTEGAAPKAEAKKHHKAKHGKKAHKKHKKEKAAEQAK